MLPFDSLATAWDDALFESSPTPMVVVASTHRFVRCNAAYCALVGYSRTELLGRTWQSITHPDDLSGDQSGADAAQLDPNHTSYTIAKRYITKRGEVLWVDLFARAIWTDGKFDCYFVTVLRKPVGRCDDCPAGGRAKPAEPASIIEWAKRNPRDAAVAGGLIGAMVGRDTLIEIVRAIVGK